MMAGAGMVFLGSFAFGFVREAESSGERERGGKKERGGGKEPGGEKELGGKEEREGSRPASTLSGPDGKSDLHGEGVDEKQDRAKKTR